MHFLSWGSFLLSEIFGESSDSPFRFELAYPGIIVLLDCANLGG